MEQKSNAACAFGTLVFSVIMAIDLIVAQNKTGAVIAATFSGISAAIWWINKEEGESK